MDPHVRTAVSVVCGPSGAAVCFCDEPHDRQAEAGAAAPAGVIRAAEAVECAFEEGPGEPGAVIDDVQLDAVVPFDCRDDDVALAVGESVLDQVVECLGDSLRVDGRPGGRRSHCQEATGLDRASLKPLRD